MKKRNKRSGKVGPSITHQYQDGNGRTNDIHISAKWRKEIDYEKLSRALLLFIEEEDAAKADRKSNSHRKHHG